jgi:hypothetical protein
VEQKGTKMEQKGNKKDNLLEKLRYLFPFAPLLEKWI